MSVRKPSTPGKGILGLFLLMAVRPGAGVAAVREARPGLSAIALLLALVGLLRGIAEGFWYYLMVGKVHLLPTLLARPDWYTKYGGPFLSVVSTAWEC